MMDIRASIANFKPHTVALSGAAEQHCPVQLSISTAVSQTASWRDLDGPWSLTGYSTVGRMRLRRSNAQEASRCL